MTKQNLPLEEESGPLTPNSFQFPDAYVDLYLAYLTPEETKVLLYLSRRIYGFRKTEDRVSISQFVNGIVTRDGKQLDNGVGMSEQTVRKALNGLIQFGIVIRAEENDPTKNYGVLYRLHSNSKLIDTNGLKARFEDAKTANRGRTETARQKRMDEVVLSHNTTSEDGGGIVAQHQGGIVAQHQGGIVAQHQGGIVAQHPQYTDQYTEQETDQETEEGENSFSPPSPIPSGEVEPFGITPTGTIEEYFTKPKPPVIQESGSEKGDGSAGGLIKNEGAFRALQRFEEKKGKIDVSRYPEDIRPVVYRFCQLSGMVPPEPSRKKGGEYSLWISSCRELLEAAGEFGPAAMEAVFKDRERERNPYSVYSPKSIVNAVRAKAGVLRMESKKKASDEGITMTDAELARVEKETQEMMQAYFASIERKPQHDNISV